MSDPNQPESQPLPPAATRASSEPLSDAERARRERHRHEPTEPIERTAVSGPLFADEPPAFPDEAPDSREEPAGFTDEPDGDPEPYVERTEVLGSFDSLLVPAPATEPHPVGRSSRPGWLVPVLLLGGLVVLLLAGAFGVGKALSGSLSGGADAPAGAGGSPTGTPYDGRTETAPIAGAVATCRTANSVDAAGHPVHYAPGNAFDGDLSTAWRCDGNGVGQKLTLDLGGDTAVAELGLVPGYAKTDPRDGTDRYAENNRITKVRWVFDDGTAVVQKLDGGPKNRELQSMRIPVTHTRRVVMEILASTPGPRHSVAVSELRVGRTG